MMVGRVWMLAYMKTKDAPIEHWPVCFCLEDSARYHQKLLSTQYRSCRLNLVVGEEIPGNRVIIDRSVFSLDRGATGSGLIETERRRQILDEDFDAAHDQGHVYGELAIAAAELLLADTSIDLDLGGTDVWSEDAWGLVEKHSAERCDRAGRIRRLTIAGALVAAELDNQLAFLKVEEDV